MKFINEHSQLEINKIIKKELQNIEHKLKTDQYCRNYIEDYVEIFHKIISIDGEVFGIYFNVESFDDCNRKIQEITKYFKQISLEIQNAKGVISKVVLPKKEFNKKSTLDKLSNCYNILECTISEEALFLPLHTNTNNNNFCVSILFFV